MADAATTSMTGRTAWARNLAAPVRAFLNTETASAVVLLGAVVAALLWANSPWWDSYESFWHTRFAITLGSWSLDDDLRHWVNDGLMTFFFLVVGLEAKRELDLGELRERSRLALPVIAALGGMAVPVAIYLVFNAGGAGAHGWGAAMSTDTAFALGLLTLLAARAPTRLRVFLLTLVVVDDLVGLVVIATAYSEDISVPALIVAAGLFAALIALRYAPTGRTPLAIVVGTGMWAAMFESGVHPTLAGLAIGLVTTAYPPGREDLERVTELTRSFREQPTPELARSAQLSLVSAVSPNERLQYRLHPWTSYVVVPIFAVANAGIHVTGDLLSDAITSPITLGIIVAYAIGKPVGIVLVSCLAERTALSGRPRPVTAPGLAMVGAVAGVGFTVSLLIASLAFEGRALDEARLGILGAALAATAVSWLVIRAVARIPDATRARQLRSIADAIPDLGDDVDPELDHLRGAHEAPVTLVEYGDYECPYCGQAEEVVRELLGSFGDDLCYVWRHLPLNDVHPHAQLAAEAAEAAGAQGRFWEMHDLLITHQGALRHVDIGGYAEELGLDVDRFWDELRRREHAERVGRDVASADDSGVTGTPTFFVNGRRHYGAYDLDTLRRVVDETRRRARLARAA